MSAEPAAPPAKTLDIASLLVAFGGLYAAGVLALGRLLDLPVPCGADDGCAQVAAHPASRPLGIPLAYVGVFAYVAILAALRFPRARALVLALSVVGALASLALLVVSHVVVGAACVWCTASGVCLLLLAVLSILRWRRPGPLPSYGWVLGPAVAVAAALGVHAGLMRKAADAPPVPPERLARLSPSEVADPDRSLGPPGAPVTVVVFGDLWCPACRTAHEALRRHQQSRPDTMRLAFRHLPLSRIRGHETSAGAAALAQIAAEKGKFWAFVDAVYAQTRPLDRPGYEKLWSDLGLPTEDFRRLDDPADPAVRAVLKDVALADALGIRSTPTFLVFVDGRPPASARIRTLPRLLNAPAVRDRLGSP